MYDVKSLVQRDILIGPFQDVINIYHRIDLFSVDTLGRLDAHHVFDARVCGYRAPDQWPGDAEWLSQRVLDG